VAIARANARRNRVERRIRLARADVTRLPRTSRRRYTVVCANLISNLLLAERDRILARLEPGGVLVLAGILATEFAAVQAAYEATGLCLLASRAQNEWRSGSFKFGARSPRASRR
jgi:ribosomal protein L11 methyltransferase